MNNKSRKTSHISNIIQFDAEGHVVLPATLTLGTEPHSSDNTTKVPSTAWVRALVGTVQGALVPTGRTITINGVTYDLSTNPSWTIDTGVLTATAGAGISVSTVSQNLNIVNTGLLSGTAGAGISVSTVNQNLNIVNTGLLSATSGAGISVSTVNQNLNIVNTGLLSATAGSGITVSTVDQNLNIVNTGLLTATAGSGITVSTVGQNLNIVNTGILTATAGAGISISVVGQNLNIVNTITDNNQLANGAGYATTSYVNTQINDLVAGAPGLLNTLDELAQALGDDPNFATTISTALGNRLRIDIGTQGLTSTQQGYGRTNLGLGSLAILSSIGDAYITDLAWSKLTGVPSTFTPSAHTHDDRYYTETEIANFFSGASAISGYNKSNWDTAYGWGNHASAGYLTTSSAASTYVSLSGSYANPAWITSLAWSKITGAPAFLTSYTETDTLATVTARGSSTTGSITINGYATLTGGADLNLKAASGSTDTGDIVFQDGSGNELHRLWQGSSTLNYRTNGGTSYQLWHTGNLTNLNQLSNGPGYITGITSSMVTTALGYTPQNSSTAITTSNIGSQSVNYAASAGSVAWSGVTSKPTTLSGYGITDGLYQARVSGLNVNAFNDTGLYRGSTGDWTNRPTIQDNAGALLQIDTHPGNYHTQLFFDSSAARLYIRAAVAGSWGSWYTIMNSGNYTDYTVTKTGSGASGTWGINITGNAGTATNLGLDYTADDWFRATADNNPVKFYGNSYQMTWRTDGSTEAYSGIGNYPFVWTYGGSSAANRMMLLDTSGNLWTSSYGWLHGYFQAASTAINTGNIGSQSVSYASSAGNADTVDGLHASSFVRSDVNAVTIQRHLDASTTWTNSALTLFLGWYSGKVVIGNNNNSNHDNASALGGNTVAVTNPLYSFSSTYSPIYYDSNDTAYYLNPAGGSRLRNLYVGDSGDDWSDPGGWGTQVRFSNGPHVRFVLHARSPGIEAGMYVHTPGSVFMGSYTSHVVSLMYAGNMRMQIEDGRIYSNVYMEAAGSMRAPIFYDSNDTSYYVDPNSTSELRNLYLGAHDSGTSEFLFGENSSGWYGMRWYWDSGVNFYWYGRNAGSDTLIMNYTTNDNSYLKWHRSFHLNGYSVDYVGSLYFSGAGHIQPNSGSYGALQMTSSKNGWAGIRFTDYNTNLMMNSNNSGFYHNDYGWQYKFESGSLYVWKNTYGGGTQATVLDSSNYGSWAAPRAYVTDSFVEFTIYGDQNTYYPVTINNWNGAHSWQRYTIHRGYSDTAPWNPIGTGSHQGGLTFSFEWAGDIAWGGNDKSIRVAEFNETYTTMVAGMQLAHCEGVVVWLRGGGAGGAYYRLHGPGGRSQGYSINMSSWTSCAGVTYSPRSYDSGTVNSEINSRYPVRGSGSGDIYVSNQAVIHSGNIGSQSVSYASSAGSVAWSNVSGKPSVATSRGEGSNYIDYARYVYNNGAYSGSGWVEPSDLGVRYAASANYATSAGSAGSAGNADTVDGYHASAFPYRSSGSSGYYQVADWMQFNTTAGLYWPSYNGAHIYPNTSTSYGSIRIDGSRNGWRGITFDGAVTLMMNDNESGHYKDGYGWQFRWYQGTMYVSRSTYGGGTEYTVVDTGNISSYTAGNANSISAAVGGTYTWTGVNYFRTNNGGYCGSLSNASLQAYSDSNNSAYMSFHKGGQYAVNMGLDADSVLRIGGWSAAANRWQLDMSGNMTVAGDVTAYSDARVKENVVTVEDALDRVQKMRGVFYNRTDSDDKKRKVGVIAQEMMEVLPEVVNQDNAGMYNVSYGNVVGVLIEAIKEQQQQIEELKTKLDGLTK